MVLVPDTELEKRNVERIPQGTRNNTKWAVGILKEWAEIRNSKAVKSGDDWYRFVEPNILNLPTEKAMRRTITTEYAIPVILW